MVIMDPEDQDTVDAAVLCSTLLKNNTNSNEKVSPMGRKVPSIEALNSEMPCKGLQKERGRKMIKNLFNRLRLKRSASVTISKPDPNYRVAYLGNVVTGWAKGDGCVEKPLATLWRNYTQSSRPDVRMQLAVTGGGLKATTKDHGLTEYWAHRLTTCAAPSQFPRLFCWVYRHEGRRLRHELRCHAVLCPTAALAKQIEAQLRDSLSLALAEFKRDKLSREKARLSLANSVYENPTIPRRKILLSTGSQNYRPPLERSKSAPKLTSIEEIIDEEEEEPSSAEIRNVYRKILRHYDSTSALLDKRKCYFRRIHDTYKPSQNIVPVHEDCCDDEEETAAEEREENSRMMKVSFSEEVITLDDAKSDLILEELAQNSLRNDLLESCERAWFNALGEKPDLIPLDSDEGSLSSGCESASTTTSEMEQPVFPTIVEEEGRAAKKTDLDFKVGGRVLARVSSLEKVYCGLNTKNTFINEEVSLIPVGESQSDFSSLKVFKTKRSLSDPAGHSNSTFDQEDGGALLRRNDQEEEENESACSDESGYEEEEVTSGVANIILV